MVRLKGRVLPQPTLLYDQKVNLNRSSWNLGNVSLRKPAKLIGWACLRIMQHPDRDNSIHDQPCKKQLEDFQKHLRRKGIDVKKNEDHDDILLRGNRDYKNLDNWFKASLKDYHVKFVLVVLPEYATAEIYNEIKRCGDVTNGMHTVCVKAKKFGEPQYDDNVALVSTEPFSL